MNEPERVGPRSRQRGRGAIRLVFQYEGETLHLVSREYVEMLVPPTDTLENYEKHQGSWAELRSVNNAVLYRQVLHEPIVREAEVFSQDPNVSIRRIRIESPAGIFVVLVPDLDEAESVVLWSSLAVPARELIRVPVRTVEKEA